MPTWAKQVIEMREEGGYNKMRNSGDCGQLESTRAYLCLKNDGSQTYHMCSQVHLHHKLLHRNNCF